MLEGSIPTALITGASGGLGAEFAQRYAADGYDVLLVARRRQALASVAAALSTRHGVRAEVAVADLADPAGPTIVAETVRGLGLAIDVLVNNAGVGLHGTFTATALERELAMIQLNVASLVQLTKMVLPAMLERNRGHVVNIASTAAFQPGPMMSIYYASKAFVLSFSEALAEELAGTGVAVTAVCFGTVPTGFQRAAGQQTRGLRARVALDPAHAVDIAYRGVRRRRRLVVPGIMNRVHLQALRFLPRRLVTRLARALNTG